VAGGERVARVWKTRIWKRLAGRHPAGPPRRRALWLARGDDPWGSGAGILFTIGLWQSYRHPEIVLFAPSEDPGGCLGVSAGCGARQRSEIFEAGIVTRASSAVSRLLPSGRPSLVSLLPGDGRWPSTAASTSRSSRCSGPPRRHLPVQRSFSAELYPFQPCSSNHWRRFGRLPVPAVTWPRSNADQLTQGERDLRPPSLSIEWTTTDPMGEAAQSVIVAVW